MDMMGGMITMITKGGTNIMNISSFVLFVSDAQHDIIEEKVNSNTLIDIIRSYPIENDKYKYWAMEVEMTDLRRSKIEMCKYMIQNFSFIAMKQSRSTYVLIPDKSVYQEALVRMYGGDWNELFRYDMLSIEERYIACAGSDDDLGLGNQVKLRMEENGCIYTVTLNKECPFLFSKESLIQIVDTVSGDSICLNLVDGLPLFKFNLAILNSNT